MDREDPQHKGGRWQKVQRVLKADGRAFTRFSWSCDGDWIAAGSLDHTVTVWDVRTGIPTAVLQGHADSVLDVTWAADSTRLASGSTDGSIKLWNVGDRTTCAELRGHAHSVTGVAWHPIRNLLASVSLDSTVRLWDLAAGRLLQATRLPSGATDVKWSPDGEYVAIASQDGAVLLLEADCKALLWVFEGHRAGVNSVAWAPSGRYIVSGAADSTVRIWSPESGRETIVLEGHTDAVTAVDISYDARFIASKSRDRSVLMWRCDTWEAAADVQEPTQHFGRPGLAFHPREPVLATLAERGHALRLRAYLPQVLLHRGPAMSTIHYTSAKVVLVGESNVGKSCLALRLAEDRYEPPESTHGMRFWTMAPEQLDPDAAAPPDEVRDVVLWDMGGQDEYRLVHQLFLDDTTLAVILLDPTRGRTAFEEVRSWNKRLERQLRGRRAQKLLVGTKLDDDSLMVDDFGIQCLVKECGFRGYYATSARNGKGIAELRAAMAEALDWAKLATTSRPLLFQQIWDEVERCKRGGSDALSFAELHDRIRKDDGSPFPVNSTSAVVKQLAMQGLLADAHRASGERVLVLNISEVERYAGAIILTARRNPAGVPAVEQAALASAKMLFPGIKAGDRLPRSQEQIVLECVVQLLLEHGICLSHERLLLFPSLFRTEGAEKASPAHSISLYYDFSGAIDNIYSSLIACLAISERFGRMRLFDDRAEFEHAGMGACGIHKVERGSGLAHLDVYFEDGTPDATRGLFVTFVDEHLAKHGIQIVEHMQITCACGQVFDESVVRQRVQDGLSDVGCPRCDRRTRITSGAVESRQTDPQIERTIWALRTQIQEKTQQMVRGVQSYFSRPTNPTDAPLRVLHISDLHIESRTDIRTLVQPLLADLRGKDGGLGLDRLDYLVVSGDLTSCAAPAEFELARQLISSVIGAFDLTAQRCIIVPGNHDLDWGEPVYDWRSKRVASTAALLAGTYIEQQSVVLVRNESSYPARFRSFSDNFYHPLVQQPYPVVSHEQGIVSTFPEDRIQFITLNSSWEIDEFFRDRASINASALARCLLKADDSLQTIGDQTGLGTGEPVLRVGVWHHPVTGSKCMPDDGFLDLLVQNGVILCLHGHLHEHVAERIGYRHPTRRLHIIGAGSFGAPAYARPESMPRLYNLLEIERDLSNVRVHTRCRARDHGPWSGWAVWAGAGPLEKRTFYQIRLRRAEV